MKINIYTDGSAIGNPGKGGYGIVMELENSNYKKSFMQGYHKTTNNRMELLAVIVGLENIKIENAQVTIWTDSKYVVDSVNNGWIFNWEQKEFKDKKNPDLWKRFLKIYRKHRVSFQWIKGHNNHPQNEICDQLARKSSKDKTKLLIDTFYEKTTKKNKLC